MEGRELWESEEGKREEVEEKKTKKLLEDERKRSACSLRSLESTQTRHCCSHAL